MSDKTEKKYMKKSEIVTFGIGLFGVALMTGWMPDYTATFFADFAFKGKGFDSATMANASLWCSWWPVSSAPCASW